MKTGWQRGMSLIVAIVVAMGPVLVCARAGAAPGKHCPPVKDDTSDHCKRSQAMDCCATSAPQAPSLPQDTQSLQQNTRASSGAPTAHAAVVTLAAILQPPAVSRIVRSAPPHGHRSTDLPTLNAVFLI